MRLALIRTLAWAPLSVRVALVALNAFLASWPALLAVTAGWVAGSVGAGGPGLAFAIVAFCVVLCLGDSLGHAADLARTHAARAVDGHVRSLVRQTLASLPRIDLAERADLADDIALATMTSGPRGVEESIGSGAGAQLIVAFRLVGAVGTALLLVPLSPVYAVVLFALTVVARRVSRNGSGAGRPSAPIADAAGRRRTEYWSELAAGEGAAKELRVFGLGSLAGAAPARRGAGVPRPEVAGAATRRAVPLADRADLAGLRAARASVCPPGRPRRASCRRRTWSATSSPASGWS